VSGFPIELSWLTNLARSAGGAVPAVVVVVAAAAAAAALPYIRCSDWIKPQLYTAAGISVMNNSNCCDLHREMVSSATADCPRPPPSTDNFWF